MPNWPATLLIVAMFYLCHVSIRWLRRREAEDPSSEVMRGARLFGSMSMVLSLGITVLMWFKLRPTWDFIPFMLAVSLLVSLWAGYAFGYFMAALRNR
jgi:hypothetical protein